MQSGEESSSSGCFNPVGHLQQSGCLGLPTTVGNFTVRNPYSIVYCNDNNNNNDNLFFVHSLL